MSDIKSVDIKGLLDTYEFPYTLLGSGQELLIRPITTGKMKKILAYENETDPYIVEEALDKLITDCVVNKDFNISELYLQDRFALLLEIRKVTKGNSYQFGYKCSQCKLENIKVLDMSELNVKEYNLIDNVIEINDNLKFEVDYPTRGNQITAVSRTKGRKLSPTEKQIDVQLGTFAASIKKVYTPEGVAENVPVEDIIYVLDNITSSRFEVFANWYQVHDFGVEFKTECKCMGCGHDHKMEIPLSDFFV